MSNPSTQPGPAKGNRLIASGKTLALLLLIGITTVALFYACANWYGRHAWNSFQAEWKAKGEPFTTAEIKPKPVPDSENVAATPLFLPLFNYEMDPVGKTNRWRDEAGRARVLAIHPWGQRDPKLNSSWRLQETVNLTNLQAFYRSHSQFPHLETPGRPGEEILKALSPLDESWSEVRRVALRPFARFPLHYEENFACLLPHLTVLRNLGRIAQTRALAQLDLGQTDEALREIQLGLRVASWLRDEPLLISQLVRIAIVETLLQPIWEGMARKQWNEAQLAVLERDLRAIRILPSFRESLRGERIFGTDAVEMMHQNPSLLLNILMSGAADPEAEAPATWVYSVLPHGWFHLNKVALSRSLLEQSIALTDDQGTRAYPKKAEEAQQVLERRSSQRSYLTRLADTLVPGVSRAGLKFVSLQSGLDLAVGATVLEQYALQQGRYPESLPALPEASRERIPRDIVNGEPLRYRTTPGGRFILYSVGWDLEDAQGVPGLNRGKPPTWDRAKGDWAWAYPAP